MDANFSALVDFVRDNPEGLEEVDDFEKSKAVVDHLLKRKMSPHDIVVRLTRAFHGDDLLRFVAERLRSTRRWRDFIDAVASTPADTWGSAFDTETFEELFAAPEDVEYLFEHHRGILTDSEHPLFNCIDADAYWMSKVRWYLVKHDHQRAWDELNKAHRGILPKKAPSTRGRCFRASSGALGILIQDLFGAMVERKMIAPLISGDFEVEGDHGRVEVYETTVPHPPRVSRPRAYQQWVLRAGFDFALLFCTQQSKWDSALQRLTPYIFRPEGVMILRVAEYFRQERNRRRKAKWQRAITEWEKNRPRRP